MGSGSQMQARSLLEDCTNKLVLSPTLWCPPLPPLFLPLTPVTHRHNTRKIRGTGSKAKIRHPTSLLRSAARVQALATSLSESSAPCGLRTACGDAWIGWCVRACPRAGARMSYTRMHAGTSVAIEGEEANICADVENVSASRRERDSWSIRPQD